jgi:transposase
MPRSRPADPPEYRQKMVELVHSGRSLAKEFEPTAQTIRNWVAHEPTPMAASATVF